MSVIGFSSVMNTRRHIRAAENRRAREKKAEKALTMLHLKAQSEIGRRWRRPPSKNVSVELQ
ncbi:MAG: hypothetical protein Q4D22_01270 [Candidatus Saccharibacteria bacterium]|nr:hypothetical protein [Candidatus Saccharibacteria bacterium]